MQKFLDAEKSTKNQNVAEKSRIWGVGPSNVFLERQNKLYLPHKKFGLRKSKKHWVEVLEVGSMP